MSCRLLPLVPPGVFYDVRIFADTWNAPISEVGAAVLRVATDLGAFAIVVAANDQVCNSRGCSAIGILALDRSACRGVCLGPQGRGVHIFIQVDHDYTVGHMCCPAELMPDCILLQPGWNPMLLGDITKWLLAAAAAHKPQAIPIALVRKQPQDSNTTLRSPSAPAAFDIRSHRAAHMTTLEEAAGAGANSEPAQGSLAAAAAAAVAAVEEEASDSTAGASRPEIKPLFEELPRSTSLWQHSDSAYM